MKIQVTHFNNALQYRMPNKRLSVVKHDNKDDFQVVETKRLLLLSDDEKKEYIEHDSPDCFLRHRDHSKFCVWYNRIVFSKEALMCLGHSVQYVDKLKKE